jgi:hypothetical protein
MKFPARALVALLSGVGSGTVCFWITWRTLELLGGEPGVGHDYLLVGSIFGPGILAAAIVFYGVSRALEHRAAGAS